MTLHVFSGHDDRQAAAGAVCEHSLVRRSSQPVVVTQLRERPLRHSGLYSREYTIKSNGQYVDSKDGKGFSTQFSYTRFLVPTIARKNNLHGWALFCDNDFLWLSDVAKLFALADPKYAVMCVKHDWQGKEGVKMDGMLQQAYYRKLWSSLVLWNVDHIANDDISEFEVNNATGSYLHGFKWLNDHLIGGLPPSWNHIPGFSAPDTKPDAMHFSYGGPWLDDHKNDDFAKEWLLEYNHMETVRNPKPAEWVEL